MSFCNFCTGSNALLKCGNPALRFHSIRSFYGFSIFEKIRGTGWIDGQTDGQTDGRGATLNAAHKGGCTTRHLIQRHPPWHNSTYNMISCCDHVSVTYCFLDITSLIMSTAKIKNIIVLPQLTF